MDEVKGRAFRRWATAWAAAALSIVLLLAACGGQPATVADLLPAAGAVPGWQPAGEVQAYDGDSLYDLVDGQADAYLAYGFEQAGVQVYEDGGGGQVRVTVWQLATPADAYGLFTASAAGTPVAVGNEGDADPGRRIGFWQGQYYVDLFAQVAVPEAQLEGLARAVSASLPAGGKRPELMARLPAGGLVARSPIFFRQEISIQDRLWLGGENLLGLSRETEGVLAGYEAGGSTAWLLLVRYPSSAAAAAALAALEGRPVEGLVSARARDGLLAAAFGPVETTLADGLVAEALGE